MSMPSQIRRSISQQSEQVLVTGRRFARFDQIRQRHFWSSYYFTPDVNGYISAGQYSLFVTPAGQNGQGFPSGVTLGDRETNWKSANRVPDNQNFEITEIGVSLGMTTPDIVKLTSPVSDQPEVVAVPPKAANEFLSNTVVGITYLTNSVPLGLAADFGQASAPHVGAYQATVGTKTLQLFRSNGFPAPSLRRKFKIPILLQHGETFSFSFILPRTIFIGRMGPGGVIPSATPTGISPIIARFDFWATESFVEKS